MTRTFEGLKNEIIAAESNIVMCEKSIENCDGQIKNFVEFFNYGIESDKNVDFLTVSARGIADALQAIASYENDIANYRKKISMCEEEMAEIENANKAEETTEMTKVNVKSAEVAKAIVAAIMPNATAEKSNNFTIGKKVQNRFYNDASGNSYCLAYKNDCETLELVNFFDKYYNVVATVEIDSESTDSNVDNAIEEIRNELGMVEEKMTKVEQNSLVKQIASNENKIAELKAELKNADNAAEKVAFFEKLKEKHNGKIFIGDVLEAWNLATCTLGKLEKNNIKTTNAGYAILENSAGDWVSELNDRFEVNLTTGKTFNIWTDSETIKNAKKYAWDEVEEGIFHTNNVDKKIFWLNVCKAKFVRVLIKYGVEDLIAADIIRNAELDACLDDYIVDADTAAEVEIENAEKAKVAVTSEEVKAYTNARGEYFSYTDPLTGNTKYYRGSVALNYRITKAELADALKEKYDLTVEKFVAMENGNAILVETEKETTKFEVGKVYFAKDYNDYYGSTVLFKVVKRDDKKVVVQYFETPPRHCAGGFKPQKYNIYTTKENIECLYFSDRYTLYANDLHNGKYAGVSATDGKFEKMTIIDGVIHNDAVTETEIENAKKTFEVKYLLGGYSEGTNHKATFTNFDIAKDFLKKLRNSDETFTVGKIVCDNATLWTLQATGDGFGFGNPISKTSAAEVEEVNEKPSEKEIFQAKIAEIKNRKHKSCIDWNAVYNDFRIAEIFNLQKDFKKFLKLGEMKRAENVFENLKLCFKAA